MQDTLSAAEASPDRQPGHHDGGLAQAPAEWIYCMDMPGSPGRLLPGASSKGPTTLAGSSWTPPDGALVSHHKFCICVLSVTGLLHMYTGNPDLLALTVSPRTGPRPSLAAQGGSWGPTLALACVESASMYQCARQSRSHNPLPQAAECPPHALEIARQRSLPHSFDSSIILILSHSPTPSFFSGSPSRQAFWCNTV
ncbi:hypothetical protein BX600DRAFT_440614 [Xylariales sp. PMI_506]|nr:hypothetical protein BX600DRAFT_440614 [Xylariales sp. PMI_506]